MKKEELRKVAYGEGKIGYFHCWLVQKQEDGSETAKALIEDENGAAIEIPSSEVQFIKD